jgi:hypothetical protein
MKLTFYSKYNFPVSLARFKIIKGIDFMLSIGNNRANVTEELSHCVGIS